MPEFLTQDIGLWITQNREAAYNTPETTGANYIRATSQSPVVYIPEPEFSTDAGRAGNASEFPTGRCLRRFNSPTINIADRANFGLYGRLALRCVGGALGVIANPATGVYVHSAGMLPKANGLQLPSMGVVTEAGPAASFLMTGGVVNDFAMSQSGDDDVQVSFNIVCSGKHRRPHQIGTRQVETATAVGTITGSGDAEVIVTAAGLGSFSPRTLSVAVLNSDTASDWAAKVRAALNADPIITGFFIVSGATTSIVLTARATAANDTTMNISLDNDTCTGITQDLTSTDTTPGAYTLPDPPAFACLDAKPFLEFNDGALQDLTSACRWKNWSVSINNNLQPAISRCGGDPKQKRGDYSSTTPPGVGLYLGKLLRGPRSISAEITYLVDTNLREWEQLCDSVQLTDVTFGARGTLLDAGGPYYEALKVIIPKAKFGVIRGADSDGFAAFTLSFEAEFDTDDIGARVEVTNADDGVSPLFD